MTRTLLSRLRRALARLRCAARGHGAPAAAEWTPTGAAIDWTGRVVRQFSVAFPCPRCGARREVAGMLRRDDRAERPDCYGRDGWPIDPRTGERLRIMAR